MTIKNAQDAFQRMLDPLPLDAFLSDVLGKRFIKLDGKSNPARHAGLLGEDPEQTIFKGFAKLSHKITFHAAGALGAAPTIEPLPSADAFRAKIAQFHALAYTVRVPDVRGVAPALDDFLRALEFFFYQPASAEVFWSGGGAKAPVHHDDVDVMAIQLKGRKRWFISKVPSDLPNAWHSIPEGAPQLGHHETVDVEPGDLLYLPRGTMHSVNSTADSMHVSIGFVPLTLRDALIACVDHMSDFSRPLREAVDPYSGLRTQMNDFGNLPERVREGLAALAQVSQKEGFVTGALQRRASRAVHKMDMLERASSAVPISLSTRLRQKAQGVHHLSGNEIKLDFTFPGGHEYIHRGAEQSVSFIARTQEFTVREIPGEIGDDVRLSLAEKFVAMGFLQVVSR